MKKSPTQRSKEHFEALGYFVDKAEHYNCFTKRRHDLAGFIDLVAWGDGETVGIQATSASNVSARVKKIADHPNVGHVRRAGWRIVVQGWAKKGRFWTVREVDCS